MLFFVFLLPPGCSFQRYQPGEERRGEELADQRLNDREHPRCRVEGDDVPVAQGGQGDETEIGEFSFPIVRCPTDSDWWYAQGAGSRLECSTACSLVMATNPMPVRSLIQAPAAMS